MTCAVPRVHLSVAQFIFNLATLGFSAPKESTELPLNFTSCCFSFSSLRDSHLSAKKNLKKLAPKGLNSPIGHMCGEQEHCAV